MGERYSKKYLATYFWQGISLILNFFSMFIVLPYLTSNPTIYGVYTVSISFSIFLSYADLGFIGAGQKYASEYFAKGDIKNEIKTIGFSNFILLIFLSVFTISFLVFSSNPSILVKGINGTLENETASSLFLILAAFSPTIILQRITQMIFSVRLEDYIIQRTNIFGNLLKIASVFWFFKEDSYNIVGYFLFSQIISFITAVLTLYLAKIRYNYNIRSLIKSIRFDKEVWKKTKDLAFTGLFMTLSWILYYELDSVGIANILGARKVAIYAVGLVILTFFRSIFGILFSPFNVRFNHFLGVGNEDGLRVFFLQIVKILSPIVLFPILIIGILAKPIILTWVGMDYVESISILQLLVFCNMFAFITYPTSFLLVAKEQQGKLYLVASILPFIFWTGIFISYSSIGVTAFAMFKLIAFVLSAIVYFKYMSEYLDISIVKLCTIIFKPLIIPTVILIAISILLINYLPTEKSKINFLIVTLTGLLIMLISMFVMYIASRTWKNQVDKLFSTILLKSN